jgi:pyridinium-3,5-biscarboxylic acid mononucleotide synthase
MNRQQLTAMFEKVRDGELSPEKALDDLRWQPTEDLGFAQIDMHRSLRQGFPEAIFSESKTIEQVVGIAKRIVERGEDLLATRVLPEQGEAIIAAIPHAQWNKTARIVSLRQTVEPPRVIGDIVVACAGTSDLPVAEEAVETAQVIGHRVKLVSDVGVAGIHRLFAHRETLSRAGVIIVVAGMEGALASVMGGLVDVPVIAVPTSVGYGAHLGGIAPLLGMLNSCSAGVTVVNIDNGFGAAVAACMMNRFREPRT